jgi:ClpP class serine protease
MTKLHFLSKLFSSVWGLDKIRGRTILSALFHALVTNQRPDEDIFGDPLPCMQKLGDIAVIPIVGVVSIDVPQWLKEFGLSLTDANDISEEIQDALNDPNVRIIVFDMSSPGGLSSAGDMLFDLVEAANKKKPCLAYCGPGRDMASTAYEAIAACTRIYCSPHAEGVGCVGTYVAYLDDTEFWAQMGLKWEIFKSGEYKGIGESVPLTQPQKDFIQSQVDFYGGQFRSNVQKYRTGLAVEDLQGQWFPGRLAARKNFVDDLADDLGTAIVNFRRQLAL